MHAGIGDNGLPGHNFLRRIAAQFPSGVLGFAVGALIQATFPN